MKAHVIALSFLLAAPMPALAQDPPAVIEPEAEQGLGLIERGFELLLRGFLQKVEPALDGMGDALRGVEPALQELLALIDDLRNYDSPRILGNGDILIPRRNDAPPVSRLPPQGEVEL